MIDENRTNGWIYCIENICNHKMYIGQTNNYCRRFKDHKRTLNQNNHSNMRLQKEWNSYGEQCFVFKILEYCHGNETLNDREIYWIKYYDAFNNGYNMTCGGTDNPMNYEECRNNVSVGLIGNTNWVGKHHTEETKKKISLGNKGKFVSQETRHKLSIAKSKPNGRVGKQSVLSRPIKQIDKETQNTIKIFDSIRQAEININGKCTGAITNCLRGKSKSAFGYYWEYADLDI